jgi:hypothetical protein
MNDVIIQRVESSLFWDGFKEESNKVFHDFLHSGFSTLCNDNQREQVKKLKPTLNEDRNIYLLAKLGDEIVGRSFSEQHSADTLFMCMSYIQEGHRDKGIYTTLLSLTIKLASEIGYLKITSSHNTSNNKIIVPKLKKGFVITGMKVNAGYGTLADLTLFLNPVEKDMQDFRCGYKRPTEEVKKVLSL